MGDGFIVMLKRCVCVCVHVGLVGMCVHMCVSFGGYVCDLVCACVCGLVGTPTKPHTQVPTKRHTQVHTHTH